MDNKLIFQIIEDYRGGWEEVYKTYVSEGIRGKDGLIHLNPKETLGIFLEINNIHYKIERDKLPLYRNDTSNNPIYIWKGATRITGAFKCDEDTVSNINNKLSIIPDINSEIPKCSIILKDINDESKDVVCSIDNAIIVNYMQPTKENELYGVLFIADEITPWEEVE